jgi:beta-glucosidase
MGVEADAGAPAGGGSSQVQPLGGYARQVATGNKADPPSFAIRAFDPPSPLSRNKARLPNTTIRFDDGRDPARAAAMARGCDATIVFAVDFSGEEIGRRSLTLPGNQDELIAAIAKANRRTIVVLETAGAVTMPWLAATGAVLEAWYPGSGGADAIADILLGEAVPSGRLPVTFPNTEADLPKPVLPGTGLPASTPFTVKYPEGAAAGYKGFADRHITPLFPFGFGLSGTHVAYDNVKAVGGAGMRVAFDIRNDGARDGIAVPQLYLTARNSRAMRRLLGWST